ncbi:GTP-binding protein [Kineothrix sp. MSJ-39]|uniref:GTP-binding protein n=1 Tax=Kineothrix sp. MSJ-39 TaxID=2841533 RepID=UPI001C0FB994|nr:CobW family GTP-binding protein [Kineothrix sp. MSJ-39]MBU5430572.1 GTP-binding protein [Kineothrix sp. MSJ-39]
MTKIDIVSGFLGAGKTTLIKKLLKEALQGEQVVLIENEFGEIGIDGGFLKEAGVEITEMNSGCICCSLVGDFASALKQVLDQYHPDRILIEPSGVGKLSDVMRAVEGATGEAGVHLNSAVAVVDAKKCKTYLKNFGEFFENQIEHAGTIILSRTGEMSEEKINQCIELIRQHNEKAAIITTPWDELEGTKIMEAIEGAKDLEAELLKAVMEEHEHEHHHHDHDDECCHHDHDHEEHEHHHDHDHEEHEHHHDHDHDHEEHEHHHDHDHEEHEHHHDHDHEEHEHHHDHDGHCCCGHDHEHGHHHADEVFTSWGMETPDKYTKEELQNMLDALEDKEKYGFILRAKGMLPAENGFIHFDYVPGESEIRDGSAEYTGKICVIGSELKEDALKELFSK